MTFDEFSKRNRKRCESPNGFNHKLHSWSLSDWFTAVMGELGEAANYGKKMNRIRDGIRGNKGHDIDFTELRNKLKKEIADTFIYLDLLAQSQGFDIEKIIEETFQAKSKEIGYTE